MNQYFNLSKLKVFSLILLFIFGWMLNCKAESVDPIIFDDNPLKEPLILPDWFKLSFLEIKADIKEAKSENKKRFNHLLWTKILSLL